MAYGDVQGVQTWRSMTLKTPASGSIDIAKGDAVKLTGAFEVNNATDAEDVVFGEALAATEENDALVPVKVSGIARLAFTGAAPDVNGLAGVLASATDGKVKKPASGNGVGRNLKVHVTQQTLTLASVQAADEVTINGVTFTAHASTTTPADREFSVGGNDAADAAALAACINDADYGVPNVTAAVNSNVVTLTSGEPVYTAVTVTDAAGTITAAVTAGYVWTLL